MKKTGFLAALAVVVAWGAPAGAESASYTFDTAHTQVMFAVDHLGFSKSHGRFRTFGGGFSFDEEAVEASSIDVTIDTASVDMGDKAWEDHLKNADFFNVAQHPKMKFKSTAVEKTGENAGRVTGDLTLLGVTKPVTLDVTFNKAGIHPYSKKYIAGFSATGKLNRSDWGMGYGLPAVGDEITLNIQVEGIREEAKTPAAKDEAAPKAEPAAEEAGAKAEQKPEAAVEKTPESKLEEKSENKAEEKAQ